MCYIFVGGAGASTVDAMAVGPKLMLVIKFHNIFYT